MNKNNVKYLYFIGIFTILILAIVLYNNSIMKPSKTIYNNAVLQMENKDYSKAMNSFQKVPVMDFIRYRSAQEKYDKCKKITENILGIWERYGDDKAGMQIKVSMDDDGRYNGKIIKSPPACQNIGFFEGEIKWRNIIRKSDSSFEYHDLSKYSYVNDKTIFGSTYGEAIIELNDDWTELNLNMKVIDTNDPSYGLVQKWKKIDNKLN